MQRFYVGTRVLALVLVGFASVVLANDEWGGGALPIPCFTLIPRDCAAVHVNSTRRCGTNNQVACADVPLNTGTYNEVTGLGSGEGNREYEQDLANQVQVYFHQYRCGNPQMGEPAEACIFIGLVNRQCTGRKLKGDGCNAV